MKDDRSFENQPNRRGFLKSQFAVGLGTLAMGSASAESTTRETPQEARSMLPPDVLRKQKEKLKHYQACLGGPFPETGPLEVQLRNTPAGRIPH